MQQKRFSKILINIIVYLSEKNTDEMSSSLRERLFPNGKLNEEYFDLLMTGIAHELEEAAKNMDNI